MTILRPATAPSATDGGVGAPPIPLRETDCSSEANNSDQKETSMLAVDDKATQGVSSLWGDAEQERKVSIREAVISITQVALPFFRGGGKRCWALLIAVVTFLAVETWIILKISNLTNTFQQALKDKDENSFWGGIRDCALLSVLLMVAVFLHMFAAGAFSLEWRRFLTKDLLANYIGDQEAFYKLKMQRGDIDNPDQRIGQDIGSFTYHVVPLVSHLIRALMTVVSMSVVLYTVLTKLFWVLMFGSLVFLFVTFGVFGPPLMRTQRTILAREASFRFALVRIRVYAESIAFYRGATFERERCLHSFVRVIQGCYRRLLVLAPYLSFQMSMSTAMGFVPATVMASEYFQGKVDFGSISQASVLFAQLMHATTILATQMDAISNLGAQAVRVKQLQEGLGRSFRSRRAQEEAGLKPPAFNAICLQEIQPPAAAPGCGSPARSSGSGASPPAEGEVCLRLSNITLTAPNGIEPLVTGLSFVLRRQQSLMISGPSGTGKSSLLRAIIGLWVGGHGSIERCSNEDCFFAPQAPYLCVGTLRENATYPRSAEFAPCPENDALVRQALEKVNIGYLVERHGLDGEVNWDDLLSGGEKQRLGFARLILRRKAVRLALLDEATSAMDLESEDTVHQLLQGCVQCYASVAHHMHLVRYHTHKLTLSRLETGGCRGDIEMI